MHVSIAFKEKNFKLLKVSDEFSDESEDEESTISVDNEYEEVKSGSEDGDKDEFSDYNPLADYPNGNDFLEEEEELVQLLPEPVFSNDG
ncbi:hypothetical protein FRX31_023964 [Thalictrum thalictroides]|uniref:Uncharacterized protein n=1 Tax=Thalictrum thalictroides TaxID=46969 RepID=A0A7J6VMY5_THATH|nr:hypothetical protein FRX31_023964 [Thalictrum thalictroides]